MDEVEKDNDNDTQENHHDSAAAEAATDSSVKPNAELPRQPTKRERIFAYLENGIVLTVMGIIGGLTGVFVDGRYFLLLSIPLALGLHRSPTLKGLSAKRQLLGYFVLLAVSLPLLWFLGMGINRSREHIPTAQEIAKAFAQQGNNGKTGNLSTSQSASKIAPASTNPVKKPAVAPGPIDPVHDLSQPGTSGNLKKRASDLADQVLRNLYRRGWREGTPEAIEELQGESLIDHYPHDGTDTEHSQWSERCVKFFETMQLADVRTTVEEMMQLHIRDAELDNLLDTFFVLQREGKGSELHHAGMVFEIGQHMKALAKQIP